MGAAFAAAPVVAAAEAAAGDPPPRRTKKKKKRAEGGPGGAGGSADAADAAAPVDDAARLRMCAPHCARLVDGSGGSGDLDSWERGEGPPPALALHTNVGNGRAFAEPPSPAFEVLPALARSVLQLLQAGDR